MASSALQRLQVARILPLISSLSRFQLSSRPSKMLTTLLKWTFILLMALNARSWPLIWHFRVFRPVLIVRGRHLLTRLLGSKQQKKNFLTSTAPVGQDPLKMTWTYTTRATPDDCDWNGHLSNSSYAKTLDFARMKAAVRAWTPFFVDGGWMALGGAQYSFVREIPAWSNYEIRITAGGWDNKWLFLVAQYVTYPKSKSNSKKSGSPPETPHTPGAASATQAAPTPSLFPTPTGSSTTLHIDPALKLTGPKIDVAYPPLPPGAQLHCTAVSQYCFKHGRITVPPILAIAVAGFGPPSMWEHAQALRKGKKLVPLLRGGWKDVPQEERWWELDVFPGSLETNKARAESLGKMREVTVGMPA